jgi:deoxyribodipyrimidine photolyase
MPLKKKKRNKKKRFRDSDEKSLLCTNPGQLAHWNKCQLQHKIKDPDRARDMLASDSTTLFSLWLRHGAIIRLLRIGNEAPLSHASE